MKKLLVFLAIIACTPLMSVSASAQETQLVVSPAIVELPVERGASEKVFLQITNNNNNALPISILAQGITINGEIIDDSISERYDSSEWIIFDKDTYVFEPGETKQISFQITAPFTAASGGHYAQLSIRGLALDQGVSSRGLVFPEIGVPIFMTIPGEVNEQAQIISPSLFPRIVQPNQTVPIDVEIENTGNVHNVVFPSVVLKKSDQTVNIIKLNPEVLLPGTKKTFSGDWLVAEYGQYKGEVSFRFGNMQEELSSDAESIAAMPPIWSLFILATVVWGVTYLYPKRKNIIDAMRVLFAK